MKRRTLLKAAPAAGFIAATPLALRAQSTVDSTSNWRTFEVATRLEITEPTGQVEAWVPLPLMQKTPWFETLRTISAATPNRRRSLSTLSTVPAWFTRASRRASRSQWSK